jgi:UDP-2,4-diacetamido-2,4,6-trideoxy-beta-L-altropyranose hydrolase
MHAVFRADGSAIIGGGHLRRCLTLADALSERGWTCSFVTAGESLLVMPDLWRSDHALVQIDNADRLGLEALGALEPIDLLIVDHYGLNLAFETAGRALARCVMVLDDIPGRMHDCDILLDQTLGRCAQEYDGLMRASDTLLLLGASYALLRPDFKRYRPQALKRNRAGLERVLVSFGATDPWGLNAPAARAACAAGITQVDIAVGRQCPHIDELRMVADEFAQVTLHVEGNMACLMAVADLGIGAAGSTSWERCCLGLPTVLIVAVDNQKLAAHALEENGAVVVISVEDVSPQVQFLSALRELQNDLGRLSAMSAAARIICDGQGSARVVDVIERYFV